jgi:carboxypeptidase Q
MPTAPSAVQQKRLDLESEKDRRAREREGKRALETKSLD